MLTAFLTSCEQNPKSNNSNDTAVKNEPINFIGAWASTSEGKPTSIYIDTTGKVYNCYFISSNGEDKSYKGIIENNILKIGNSYTIKFLSENDGIYLVENGMNFKRMEGVREKIEEIRKAVKSEGGSYCVYIPFTDDYANTYNEIPNFTIKQNMNIYEAEQRLFDKNLKDCILSSNLELTSYYDLQKDETLLETMGNYLVPWEYTITCKHSSERDLTMVFSIRDNEYYLTRIQYFP